MASPHDAVRMGGTPHWEREDVIGKMTLSTLLFSHDYRHIAIKGMLTSVVMLGLGGLMAILFRTELAVSRHPDPGCPTLYVADDPAWHVHGLRVHVIPFVVSIMYYMMPKDPWHGRAFMGARRAMELLDIDPGGSAAGDFTTRLHLDILSADVTAVSGVIWSGWAMLRWRWWRCLNSSPVRCC